MPNRRLLGHAAFPQPLSEQRLIHPRRLAARLGPAVTAPQGQIAPTRPVQVNVAPPLLEAFQRRWCWP